MVRADDEVRDLITRSATSRDLGEQSKNVVLAVTVLAATCRRPDLCGLLDRALGAPFSPQVWKTDDERSAYCLGYNVPPDDWVGVLTPYMDDESKKND